MEQALLVLKLLKELYLFHADLAVYTAKHLQIWFDLNTRTKKASFHFVMIAETLYPLVVK